MKRLLLTMTALAAAAGAAPAIAQYATPNSQVWSGVDIRNRIAALDNRFDAGVRSGSIGAREEGNLRVQLDNLRRLERQYSYNGLTFQERRDLQDRVMTAQNQLQLADAGADRRGNAILTSAEIRERIMRLEMRLDEGFTSGEISRSEERALRRQLISLNQLQQQYSTNGLTMRERDILTTQLRAVRQNINFADNGRYDRDTRYSWVDDNGYVGVGGPIEVLDACADRGGLTNVFNSLLGRGCLRVGEMAPRNLYPIPYQYRNQYRDTADAYYRQDGDMIYAIDARTGRVVSSWDVDID